MLNLQSRKPRKFRKSGFAKPMEMLAIMAGEHEIVARGARVCDHFVQRALKVMRVADAKHPRTVECLKIEREIDATRIRPDHNRIEATIDPQRRHCGFEVIDASWRPARKHHLRLIWKPFWPDGDLTL